MQRLLMTALTLLFFSCHDYETNYKLFTVSSPDGKRCLSFTAEYNGHGTLINNRYYLLGYNPDKVKNSPPDSNYVLLECFSTAYGVKVKWSEKKIIVRDNPIIENKLSDSSEIDYNFLFKESELIEMKKTIDKLWFNYDFYRIVNGKYKSCIYEK